MDLISLEVMLACRKRGCPICRLRHRAERRYLTGFLWENVNDAGIRQKLVRSLGFCHTHAWQLQDMEETRWGDGMGTAIVYDDLARRALRELEALRQNLPLAPARLSLHDRVLGWLSRLQGNHPSDDRNGDRHILPTGLVPRAMCRVCEIGAQATARHTSWLIRDCTEEARLEAACAQSDGLCLPHLRTAVALAAQTNPAAAHLLLDVAIARLQTVTTDLSEYVRKHSYQYRDEQMSPGEQEACIRAVAWFTGEKRTLESEYARLTKEGPGNS